MVAFQAPGAPAKYRLGNEAETYGEMIFVNNWINPSRDPDKAWMKTEVLVQANTTQAQSFSSTDQFRFREAFVQVGNVLKSNPGAEFWAGERYYRRLNIDINDFYILDTSGYGGGVENLNVKIGQMSVAYLGGAKDDLITSNGVYPKSLLDVRLYGVKTPVGTIGSLVRLLVLEGRHARRRNSGAFDPEAGPSASVTPAQEWLGGYNRISLQYGVGQCGELLHQHRRANSLPAKRPHVPLYRQRRHSAQQQVRHPARVHLPVANQRQPRRRHQHLDFIRRAPGLVLYRSRFAGVRSRLRPHLQRRRTV